VAVRRLGTAFALVLAALALDGCGGSGDAPPSSGAGRTESPVESAVRQGHARKSRTNHANPVGPRLLWEHEYVGTSVRSRDGERVPIAFPEAVEVSISRWEFPRGKRRTAIGWEARCNGYGTWGRVSQSRVHVGEISASAVGCDRERNEEDDWLADFFAADPFLRRDGDRLVLSARSKVLRLRVQSGR